MPDALLGLLCRFPAFLLFGQRLWPHQNAFDARRRPPITISFRLSSVPRHRSTLKSLRDVVSALSSGCTHWLVPIRVIQATASTVMSMATDLTMMPMRFHLCFILLVHLRATRRRAFLGRCPIGSRATDIHPTSACLFGRVPHTAFPHTPIRMHQSQHIESSLALRFVRFVARFLLGNSLQNSAVDLGSQFCSSFLSCPAAVGDVSNVRAALAIVIRHGQLNLLL